MKLSLKQVSIVFVLIMSKNEFTYKSSKQHDIHTLKGFANTGVKIKMPTFNVALCLNTKMHLK